MLNRYIFYFSLLVLVLSTLSFQWPIENSRITSTFCESRSDHFHDGLDVVGSNDEIYPVQDGELLYQWDKVYFPFENYPGGGNYKVIQSKDTCSVYMHLQDGASPRKVYSSRDLVGLVGNSGHSYAKHLHLCVLDSDRQISRNPLLFLPKYPDKQAPGIFDIYFHIDDRYHMIKNKAKIRLTEHHPLLIKIVDTIMGDERLGIYKLKVKFNGEIVADHDFKALQPSSKGLLLNKKTFDTLFDEAGYYKISGITYKEGLNHFAVFAEDIAGNKSTKEFVLDVNLDFN